MPERLFPLSGSTRLAVVLLGLALVLGLVNRQVLEKEAILRDGRVVLLELAPVDPRSLLQGDYMALRYALAGPVAEAADRAGLSDGRIVAEADELGAARFVAIDAGQNLAAGQFLLRFRRRGESVRLGSDAYFFEEGQGEAYRDARFGELRVGPDGEAVLTGLRDASGQRLGPQ